MGASGETPIRNRDVLVFILTRHRIVTALSVFLCGLVITLVVWNSHVDKVRADPTRCNDRPGYVTSVSVGGWNNADECMYHRIDTGESLSFGDGTPYARPIDIPPFGPTLWTGTVLSALTAAGSYLALRRHRSRYLEADLHWSPGFDPFVEVD